MTIDTLSRRVEYTEAERMPQTVVNQIFATIALELSNPPATEAFGITIGEGEHSAGDGTHETGRETTKTTKKK